MNTKTTEKLKPDLLQPEGWTEVPHHCKFCKKPVSLKLQNSALKMFKLEYWLSLAACNRCADYHSGRNRIVENLVSAAQQYRVATEKGDAKHKAAQKIITITKIYAKHMCAHFKAEYFWQSEFSDMIITNPNRVDLALKDYHHAIEFKTQAVRYSLERVVEPTATTLNP